MAWTICIGIVCAPHPDSRWRVAEPYAGDALDPKRRINPGRAESFEWFIESRCLAEWLLDLAAEGSGSRLWRLSGIRLELEELLKLPVDDVCEELLKDPLSEAARRQAIAL